MKQLKGDLNHFIVVTLYQQLPISYFYSLILRHAWGQPHALYYLSFSLKLSQVQFLEKCYDNKMVKSPYNCVIFPLTQPQVANQQQQQQKIIN